VKKDLLAEHATLANDAKLFRARIKEGLFGGASANSLRELERQLFRAEDRMKSIERSEQWKSRPPVVKVTH
jgi:hypothetical protein